MEVIYKYQHLIDNENISWYEISSNPNSIHLLEKKPDNIQWSYFSSNPNAIHLLHL